MRDPILEEAIGRAYRRHYEYPRQAMRRHVTEGSVPPWLVVHIKVERTILQSVMAPNRALQSMLRWKNG